MNFSVVIPLYNKGLSIAATIDSVLSQTLAPSDIIVIDDGSTDDGPDVVSKIEVPKLKLFRQRNAGVSAARNLGVKMSSGEVIAFLDADDFWAVDYLETLAGLIADNPDAGMWGLAYGTIENGQIHPSWPSLSSFRGDYSNPWLSGVPFWTGATAVSRSAFEKAGGFDVRISHGEDLDLWFRILLASHAAYDGTCGIKAFYRLDAENRAMNRKPPIEKTLPFYVSKYADARAGDAVFRKYFDAQCIYRLFDYAGDPHYRKQVREILAQIDFSLQKPSMRLRFVFPSLYREYTKFARL